MMGGAGMGFVLMNHGISIKNLSYYSDFTHTAAKELLMACHQFELWNGKFVQDRP